MKSLNQIIAELEDFATAHWQIHTFGHGDVWEISPQSSDIVYPVLWMVPQTATPTLNEVVDEFTVLCMDLVDSGERNETEVLSDTRQIILDVCAYYRQTHTNSYIIEFGGSIQPFTERDPERVSGHSLTIRIKQPHDYNLCAVPANAVPVPPIPSCADATVQNAASNPTYQASVASGGALVLPQLKVLDSDGVTPILANYIPNTSGYAATCSTPTCADASVTVNTAPFGTAPSGGGLNVPVVNGGSTPVGSKQGSEWVIGNNATFINGTQVTDQEAEVDANIFVTLDGAQSGTWNAGLQTWEVTGASCADANLQINGVQQETIASGGTFNLIATLDGVAGGLYNAGTNTLSFTSNTGWIRPSDWIALPELTSADERVCMLVIVFENRLNRVTVKYPNLTASTDWGDGTAATVSNGSRQEHTYDYSSISGTVYQWPESGENYKQCLLSTTRVGGAIANADFSQSYSTVPLNQPSYIVDAIISLPNATVFYMTYIFERQLHMLERLRIKSLGTIPASSGWIRLGYSRNMQSLELPSNLVGNWAGALSLIGRTAVPDMNWNTVNTVAQMFQTSDIISHGYLIANSSVSLAGYADGCENLVSFGYIDAPVATNATQMFFNCNVLQTVGDIDAPLLQNCANMLSGCLALGSVRFLDASAITTTTNMFANCLSLYDLEMFGLTRGVNLTNSSMGNYGMGNFAASLGTASGAQNITVTGTPFGALLTALDATALAIRLVMTGKGYTVVN